MNKARRSALRNISSALTTISDDIEVMLTENEWLDIIARLEALASELETLKDEEEECADNMPENLQNSTKYDDFMEAVGEMEDAIDEINETITAIQAVMKDSEEDRDLDDVINNLDYAIESVDNASF